MTIDDAELRRLERLARIRLDDEERATLRDDLQRVLGHLGELAAVDVEGLEPMLRPVHLPDATRRDRIAPGLPRATVLALGQAHEDDFLRVPRTGGDG